jgi:hypothetical protein
MNRTLKLSLFCFGIFASGIVVGGIGVRHFFPPAPRPMPVMEGFGPKILRRLTLQLELSDAQLARIRPIIEKNVAELQTLRRDSIHRSTELLEAMNADVAAQLTPAQQVKFTLFKLQQRKHLRTFAEERQRRKSLAPQSMSEPENRRTDDASAWALPPPPPLSLSAPDPTDPAPAPPSDATAPGP